MDTARLLIDPDVRRHLGDRAVADVAARIEPSGDCVVCHTTLTDGQVSLTVHAAATDPLLVLPAHASCQPSALVTHAAGRRPMSPAPEYHINTFVLPVSQMPAGKRGPRLFRRHEIFGIPTVLINPNVDVQIGDVVDDRWQPSWAGMAADLGLTVLTPQVWLPPQDSTPWGMDFSVEDDSDSMTVRGPGIRYFHDSSSPEFIHLLNGGGICLVLLSDTLPANRFVDFGQLGAAFRTGELFGAWAQLGAPTPPLVATQSRRPFEPMPDEQASGEIRSGDELIAELEDLNVCARATFSNDPAVGLGLIAVRGESPRRMPVLLMEPRKVIGLHRTDTGTRSEARIESAIGNGLKRMTTTDHEVGIARNWSAHPIPDGVELTAPFGQVVARGQATPSTAWLAEAARLGQVVVVYGPLVGVRCPPDGSTYRNNDRRAELARSRRDGIAAWGAVAWGAPEVSTSSIIGERSDAWSSANEPGHADLLKMKLARMNHFDVSVSDAVSALIDRDSLQRWLTNMWPVCCQTCGHSLGAKVDVSVYRIVEGNKVLVSMHHASCRPSGVTPPSGVTMTAPTESYAASCLGDPSRPPQADVPIMVVNPSCEQLVLAQTKAGDWRNATLDTIRKVGFAYADRPVPPRVRRANVRIVDDRIVVTVSVNTKRKIRWSLDRTPDRVREQIQRLSGMVVAVTTKTLPTRLDSSSLPVAFNDPEVLIGWVSYADQPSTSRSKG